MKKKRYIHFNGIGLLMSLLDEEPTNYSDFEEDNDFSYSSDYESYLYDETDRFSYYMHDHDPHSPEFNFEDEIRLDGCQEYTVIEPTELSADTIRFHLLRADSFVDDANCIHEIELLVRCLAHTHKNHTEPTRRQFMNEIFGVFVKFNETVVEHLLGAFLGEHGMSFKFTRQVMDVLNKIDKTSARIFTVLCASMWTMNARRNARHGKQIRYFTEMLDNDQLEKYFDLLHFYSDDEYRTNFLMTHVFYDWVRDYDFQKHLYTWLWKYQYENSIEYFSSTFGFHRKIIVSETPRVCATSKKMCYLNAFSRMWKIVHGKYQLDDDIINIAFQFIDLIPKNNTTTLKASYILRQNWSHTIDVLFPVIKRHLSRKDFQLFLCDAMCKLIEKENSDMIEKIFNEYFPHLSPMRRLIICFNRCNLEEYELPILSSLYTKLSITEKDAVFTTMCIGDNILAAQWIATRQSSRYMLTVTNKKIVSYDIGEMYSPLENFGFKIRRLRELKQANDECVVCLEPLESIVVLNCHPTHQICEDCCRHIITTRCTKKCPLCRGEMRSEECNVYVAPSHCAEDDQFILMW